MPATQYLGTPVTHLRQPGGQHHSNNHHREQISDPGYDPTKEPEVIHKKTKDNK